MESLIERCDTLLLLMYRLRVRWRVRQHIRQCGNTLSAIRHINTQDDGKRATTTSECIDATAYNYIEQSDRRHSLCLYFLHNDNRSLLHNIVNLHSCTSCQIDKHWA